MDIELQRLERLRILQRKVTEREQVEDKLPRIAFPPEFGTQGGQQILKQGQERRHLAQIAPAVEFLPANNAHDVWMEGEIVDVPINALADNSAGARPRLHTL